MGLLFTSFLWFFHTLRTEGVEKQMAKLTRERDFNTILSDPKQRGRYGQ